MQPFLRSLGCSKSKAMTLSFKIYAKLGRVQWYTGFVEKIIKSLEEEGTISRRDRMGLMAKASQIVKDKIGIYINTDGYEAIRPKKHTIRAPRKKRQIRAGDKLHLAIFNRSTSRLQFAPTLKCTHIDEIAIHWEIFPGQSRVVVLVNGHWEIFPGQSRVVVLVNGRRLSADEVRELAINDGFDNTHDFFQWFNQDFKGYIIHWTKNADQLYEKRKPKANSRAAEV